MSTPEAEAPVTNGIKVPSHSMPSDYSDVHPKSYDPEYISQISSQMQIPDRISASCGDGDSQFDFPSGTVDNKGLPFNGMMVPDRILVAGDNQHIGVKSDLALQLRSSETANPEAMSYVGLLTPPRTLTMEEAFPTVDEPQKEEPVRNEPVMVKSPNGHVVQPSPYDPGVTLHDSLLMTEEDEVTMLRRQMSKLVRRVHVIEEEQKKRSQREFIVYPVFFGYFLWKVLGWLVRDSRS